MTRIHHAHAQNALPHAILNRPRAAPKKKKPYKIVLEAVTQEKKKLQSILTYASDAPQGFGFIPAGNPEITEWCKEQCRQRNLDVHIVSAKPKNRMHADPEKLSHHVHRVGHHFPLEIINLACSKFGYTYDDTNGLRKDKDHDRTNWIAQRMEAYSSRKSLRSRPTTVKEDKEHTQGAIREMFPKIPEEDMAAIVNHAFEEGTNRVGNAKELPLARRVQLAVVAHIRHVYTEYDKILKNKSGSWLEARQKVEHVSLAKLKEWRDETGEQSDEVEETFREIIVLDDDDDESTNENSPDTPDEREQSMEIVSSRATDRDLQPERYTASQYADGRALQRLPRRTILLQPYSSSSAVLPASPQRRAIQHPQADPGRRLLIEPLPRRRERGDMYDAVNSRAMPPYTESAMRYVPLDAHDDSAPRTRIQQPPPSSRPLVQEIDGRLYHLEPIRDDEDSPAFQYERLSRVAPRNERISRPPPPASMPRSATHSRRTSEQDVVLPSVEREIVDLTSPRRTFSGKAPYDPTLSHGYVEMYSPKRKPTSGFEDDVLLPYDQGTKRLRPLHEEIAGPRPIRHQEYGVQDQDGFSQKLHRRPEARDLPRDQYVSLISSPRRNPAPAAHNLYAQSTSHSGGQLYQDYPPPPLSREVTAERYTYSARPLPPIAQNGGMYIEPSPHMSERDERYYQRR